MIESVQVSRELIDQIVFGMENQDALFFLDALESRVVVEADKEDGAAQDRYLEVPEWRSVDGYNLMERFVATLHNPIYRERLRSILASGRGVFRQFKDTVRERREIERAWFGFKERHMRRLVYDWLNLLREQAGLERFQGQILETSTDELVDVDFVFRDCTADEELDLVAELDHAAFQELYPDLPAAVVELLYNEQRAHCPAMNDQSSRVRLAETQGAELSGFLWATVAEADDHRLATIRQLYVLPEYRGLGVARSMLRWFFELAHSERIDIVTIALQGEALPLARHFVNYGLTPVVSTLTLDVERWYRAEHLA